VSKEKALHIGVRLGVAENLTNNALHSSQDGVRREKECQSCHWVVEWIRENSQN
jgi:hypothetical protein